MISVVKNHPSRTHCLESETSQRGDGDASVPNRRCIALIRKAAEAPAPRSCACVYVIRNRIMQTHCATKRALDSLDTPI